MTLDVFAIAYNEAFMLPHFIKHYQSAPFNANITIFDNFSTDNSKEIIIEKGCNYKTFDTGGQIRDDLYLSIKNEAFKTSKAQWVINVDIDELLEIDFPLDLYNVIRTQGYDMIGAPPSRLGVSNNMYSKMCMFRPDAVFQVGYNIGCHSANPTFRVPPIVSPISAKLLHYKYISEDFLYQRHLVYQSRLSEINKTYNWGSDYMNVEKEKINKKFEELRAKATLIPTN